MAAQVLETIAGSNGQDYHIKRSKDGAVYCTCTGWKFSKLSPKTCKHLEAWHAKQASKTARVSIGTIVVTASGKEWIATRKITGAADVWGWEDDSGSGIPICEKFDPSIGEKIVGHVADRLSAAVAAASSPAAPNWARHGAAPNWALYAVICRADRQADGSPGEYELGTRQVFARQEDAIDYALTFSTSREPIVVQADWRHIKEHGPEHSSRIAVRVTRPYRDDIIGEGSAYSLGANPDGALKLRVDYANLRLPGTSAPRQHVPEGPSVFESSFDWL